MIAVDCGSNDLEAVALAQSLGMDVIILDHHTLTGSGPENAILVSAQLRDDGTYRELTGVGIAYLFALSLMEIGYPIARLDNGDASRMLDLVAIGTVADVGALRGANRILVSHGLERIRQSDRPGIRAMLRHGEIEPATFNADRIAYGIGPRLNAAGRVSSPQPALQLLLTEDDAEADRLAMQVERWNQERKKRTNEILADVSHQIMAMPDWQARPFLALYGSRWDKGLVGPIAAKISERMGVPALVLHEQDGVLTGSGRSVPGINLLRLLESADGLMTRYGGHSGAAGVTMPLEHYDAFVEAISRCVADHQLELPQPPALQLHAWLPEKAQQISVARVLDVLEPYGQDNPYPVFGVHGARVRNVTVMGREKTHLKITIGTRGREMEAVLWGGASRADEVRDASTVDLAGTLGVNRWNGVERLQMILKDFRPSS
jgi:single-stranded-DNA-specific exonuclease